MRKHEEIWGTPLILLGTPIQFHDFPARSLSTTLPKTPRLYSDAIGCYLHRISQNKLVTVEIFALLGCYAAMIENFLPKFRNYVSVQSSRVTPWTSKNRPIRFSQTWVSKYHSTIRKIQEDEGPNSHTGGNLEICSVKFSYVFILLGGVPFGYWAVHRQFRLRLTVVLLSSSKQITQQPPDFTFLTIHHHPILKHITKWSLIINNMIRTSTVICHL